MDAIVDRVLDLAIAIQQIPAPTFAEEQRAGFVRELFQAEGLADVAMDEVWNVYARLPGEGLAPPLVVSAHTDTVFPAHTDLKVVRDAEKIAGPGIGDNSLGVAGLFGLLWSLRARSNNPPLLPGDLWLVANVCEEGVGDLRGMRAVVNRFGGLPLAYIVLEGMALGQIYHRGLGVRRYRITATTQGGHSWVDHGRPSAVHELARLVNQLLALPLPNHPRTILNVGVISGGISVNTIASAAYLELDLRSEEMAVLEDLAEQVEALAVAANRPKVRVSAEVIGDRPVGEISARHPLTRLGTRSLKAAGIKPLFNIGSTDANIPLSRGLPAVCLGLTTGGNAHTLEEFIHTGPVAQGLAQLVAVVDGAFQELVRVS